MAKFSRDRFPPGFFDLPPSAGEALPLDIIAQWTRSDQTADVARGILAPHTLQGILVSSDAAGLTRLTRERPLVEILAMVSHPKELIHAYGRAIGGRGIGVWAADNTQMFYGDDVAAQRVVAMLRTAMARIAAECEVGIGVAAHAGEFFELGGGTYGPDADRVEGLAEAHTSAGELLITDALALRLPAGHGFATDARGDLAALFGGVQRVTHGPVIDGLDATDTAYPAPYSEEFTEGLATYNRTRRDSRAPRPVFQERAVVFIVREREEVDVPHVAVLNDLAMTAAMKRIGTALLKDVPGDAMKNAGNVGIYAFAECAGAIAFARAMRESLSAQGIQCRIGIDTGPVLLFDLGPGVRDIAGSPVNVASKLADEVGAFGMIQVSDAVAKTAGAKRERPTRVFMVSDVELRAYDL